MIEKDPSLGEPLVAGLPYLKAEAVYAATYEMARTVDDVLARRTRSRILARDAADDAAPEVARLIGPVLGLSEAEQVAQVADYRARSEVERSPLEVLV
jgi:glycerol-3-phosphate dehydrogenase